MFKIGLIVIAVALILAVIGYTWLNRDSDRVVLTFVTAMLLGSLGFLTKETISNKLETYTAEFPVAVFFGWPDYRPLNINLPYGFDLQMLLQGVKEEDLPKSDHLEIGFAEDIYFSALQIVLLKKIFERYGRGWDVTARRYEGAGGARLSWTSNPAKGKIIKLADVLKNIPHNYFVENYLVEKVPDVFGGQITLPLNTDYSISADDNSFVIKMQTGMVDVDIKLSVSDSRLGIGEYDSLLGLGDGQKAKAIDEINREGNSIFLLSYTIKQNYFKNGHPQMAKHRNWADSMYALLNAEFNFGEIKQKHRQMFQLYGPNAVKHIVY